jgi:pyruvate,orthophosphate dikinase
MTRVLGPDRVPAGFTVTTEACVDYLRAGGVEPAALRAQIDAALARLEAQTGKRLGDPRDPLLVSVRSGARDSMPGMLESILNLGLNDEAVAGLASRTGNERFAWDSYRRLVQMFGDVVGGVPGERFEAEIAAEKRLRGVVLDTELDAAALRDLTRRFQALYDFPTDPRVQLERAVRAVFDSWNGARAVEYRRLNRIPDDWGTAVNVQQMVFGNKGPRSCSGVAFSRDELTGAPQPSGDFLADAQGEDVVSGVRTPRDLAELAAWMPEAHDDLLGILRTLERHYGDMQDVEFTVEDGRLYLLQTRSAKRPCAGGDPLRGRRGRRRIARAAPGGADDRRAGARCAPAPDVRRRRPLRGAGARRRGVSGAAKGAIVFTAAAAVAAADRGESVILVRPFTEADDVAGCAAARGILTSEGGRRRMRRSSLAGWAGRR